MADNYDGSIVIDTELDREGFEQGAEKMLSALKELTADIKGFGASMGKSMETAIDTLRAIGQNTEMIYDRLGGGATQAADANARFAASMNEARESVSGAAQAADAYDSALAKTQQKIDAQKAKLSEYYRQVAEIQSATDEALAHTTTDDQAAKVLEIEEIELQKLNDKYAVQLKTLKDLEAEYQRLAAAQSQARQSGNPAPAYNVEDVKTIAADIEKADKAVDGYRAKVEKMRSVGASDSAWKSTRYDISQATAQLQEYRRNLDELKASGKISPEDYERLSSALDTAAEKAQKLSASQHLSVFKERLQQIGTTALRTAGNLARMPFKAMAGAVKAAATGVKSLGNRLKTYVSQAKNAKLQSNALVKALTSMKRLLITRIKRMFISSIFNSAKESLQTLAKFSDTFNTAMSNIKNSAKQLSGNLAVSMGTLIEKIEPILTKFIDTLSKVITYVNAFFALLGGKSTMTVAKKQTDSYRDSLDGAAKSAEDLKNQVYGFDELNKRNDKDDDSGASDGSDLFEEVPIDSILPDKLKEFFEELKQLWEDSDFFNFGKKLGEGLSDLMQTLDDWINNKFRPKGVEWAKNIAELLNGLVDGVNWDTLGKTVADGINSVFDILNTFLKTFDFEKLGRGLGDSINSLFKNIEWDLIGETFANKWNALIDFIFGIVDEIDWAQIGDSLAEGFSSFINTVDWDKTAQTITTSINGIVEAFQHFIDGVDWDDMGAKLGKFINDLFEGVDWEAAGKMLGDAVKGVLNFIKSALEETDWQAIGHSVADFIRGIDWNGVADALFEGIGAALGALAAFLWGLIEDAWNSVVEWWYETAYEDGQFTIEGLLKGIWEAIKDIGTWIYDHIFKPFIDGFKKAFGIASPSTVMAEMGKYIVEGLLQGIKNAWAAITQFFTTAVEAIKTALSTAWNAVKQAATTAWEGIKTAVTQKFTALKESLSTTVNAIKTTLSNAWNAVKQTATTAWENIKSAVTQKFTALKESLSNTVNAVKTALSNAWNAIKQTASTAWENIKSDVKQKFDAVKQNLSTTAENIKTALSNAWNNIKQTASSVWESVKSTVTEKANSLKTGLINAVNGIKTDLSNGWNTIKQTATTAWGGITSTVTGLWNGLKSALQNTEWWSVGQSLVSGLQSGIQSAWSWLSSTVSSLASSLTSGLRSIFGIHSPSKAWAQIGEYLDLGLQEGLENEKSGVLSTVSNLAKSVNAELTGEQATLSMNAELSGVTTELSGVAGVLSGIANTFREITEMLTRSGGIHVPAIAEGTEVPYKTKVADSGGVDPFDSGTFTRFTSDVDERFSDLSYILRQILERFDRLKNIDTDELAAAIAFAMNRETRGYGAI